MQKATDVAAVDASSFATKLAYPAFVLAIVLVLSQFVAFFYPSVLIVVLVLPSFAHVSPLRIA
jgi:hypothetical protein